MQAPTSPEKISLRNHENSLQLEQRLQLPRTSGKPFALIRELCDFGDGKKVKKIKIKYILYNSYVPLKGDMVLE